MKNTTALVGAFLLLQSVALSAQDEKGVSPLPAAASAKTATATITRAVVVGISDYQDPGIPDLQFAHLDAEAFAGFLRSPAGGSLPDDNIQLLLNQNATRAQLAAKLDWLIEQCREGDQAIIYFSGHGDVDTKKFGQEGFLLCWDTPAQSYMVGAYPLYFLKIVVSTLSLEKKAKVVVIADACHAGKLGGSSIGGAQYTNANLAQQFANEIKILSCQPDEYSIEGAQWGGGRGAFSYHLVDGLYGLADNNADRQVTLSEMDRYLEDHVTKEVAPVEQTPIIIGDKKERLAGVIPGVLAQWQKSKSGQLAQFKQVDNRGLEDEVLAAVDSSIRESYYAFKKAVKAKAFFEPSAAGGCADAYYERLILVPELKPLYGWMRRNYAAALQDDAQQYINRIMNSEYPAFGEWNLEYRRASDYLAKAASILGESHYLYKDLKAKEFFFRAGKIVFQYQPKDSTELYQLLRTGYGYDNQLPVLYAMEAFYARMCLRDYARAEQLYLKAIELAPNWALEYCFLGYCYAEWPGAYPSEKILGNKQRAKECWEKAIELKPGFCRAYAALAVYYLGEGDYAKAKSLVEESIGFGCMARSYIERFLKSGDYETAIELVEKNLAAVPDSMYLQEWQFWPCSDAYLLSYDKNRYLEIMEKASANFIEKKDKSIDITYFDDVLYLAQCQAQYLLIGRYDEAIRCFEKLEHLPDSAFQTAEQQECYRSSVYLRGLTAYIQGRYPDANEFFNKCLELDSVNVIRYSAVEQFLGPALLARRNGELSASERWFDKAFKAELELDSNLYFFVQGTLYLAVIDGLQDDALLLFAIAAGRFPTHPALPYHQGGIYHNQMNRPDLAIPCYRECLKRNSTFKIAYYSLAKACLQTGDKTVAFEWLERGLQKGYISRKKLDGDPVWESVRETKRFRGLLRKYLAEKE